MVEPFGLFHLELIHFNLTHSAREYFEKLALQKKQNIQL